MAENETARRGGSEAQGGGFVVRSAQNGRQAHRRTSEEFDVGGFVVTEAADVGQGQGSEASTVSVEQPLPRTRRCSICGNTGHTARNCEADGIGGMATRAPRRPAKEAVASIAPMLVGTFNLFVIESMGEPCGITEMEAKFLIPSVQRTLERMPAGAATRAAVILDPLIIVGVMGMWLKRISDIKRADALQKYVRTPYEQARANGVSGTEYRVETSQAADYPVEPQHVFQSDPNHPAHCMYCALPYDNLNEQGAPLHYPMQADVPTPEHPDFTANGVPSAIRDSFDAI